MRQVLILFTCATTLLAQDLQIIRIPFTPEARASYETQCKIETATDRDEPALLRAHSSPQLTAALTSWNTLWALLNDPDTSYLDRLAAASKGVALVTPEHLVEFWSASQVSGTFVDHSPCCLLYCASVLFARPGVPAYPLSPEDRNRSPFNWQRSRALDILKREIGTYYADPSRYPAMVRALEGWRTSNSSQEQLRSDALLQGPRNMDWLRVAIRLGAARELSVCCDDRYPFEELIYTAQLVILTNAKDNWTAETAVSGMSRMADLRYNGPARDLRSMRTSTGTLAASRWAMRSDIDGDTRYQALVGPLMNMVENPPFTFDRQLPRNDPRQQEYIQVFEKWFAENRERLEREAAAERPHLQSLLDQLNAAGDRWVLP